MCRFRLFAIHFTVSCRAGNMVHNLHSDELASVLMVHDAAHCNARKARLLDCTKRDSRNDMILDRNVYGHP